MAAGAFLVGILILSRYPITEAVYAELITGKDHGVGDGDPRCADGSGGAP